MMILVIFAPFVYNITLSKTGKDLYRLWQMSRSDPGDAGGDGKAGTSSVNITKSGR